MAVEKLVLKHLQLLPLTKICCEYLEPNKLWVVFNDTTLWSVNLCDSPLQWTKNGPKDGKLEFDNWVFEKAGIFLLTSKHQLFCGTLDVKQQILSYKEDRRIPDILISFIEEAFSCVLHQNILYLIGAKGFEKQAVQNFPGKPKNSAFANLSLTGLACEWRKAGWCHDDFHGRIYRFGGQHNNLHHIITSSASFFSLSGAVKTWAPISSSLTIPRMWCSATLHPESQKIFVSGGLDGKNVDITESIEIFDLRNQCFIWRKRKLRLPFPLWAHASFCWQNWFFVCDGLRRHSFVNKSIWKRKLNSKGQFLGDWVEVNILSDPHFDQQDFVQASFYFA